MSDLTFSAITDADVAPTIELWKACGLTRPWNDPANDIAFARKNASSTILVGRETRDGPMVASVMAGHDGHRGWVYYLSVDPAQRGKGYGKQIMKAAEGWMLEQGVWKAQLLVREGNEKVIQFYDDLDYKKSCCLVLERWIDPTKRGDYQPTKQWSSLSFLVQTRSE